jgi:hypothetical protein
MNQQLKKLVNKTSTFKNKTQFSKNNLSIYMYMDLANQINSDIQKNYPNLKDQFALQVNKVSILMNKMMNSRQAKL